MIRRRLIYTGWTLIVIAVFVILAGAIWPVADRLLALGALLALPFLLAIAGCVLVIVGMIRRAGDGARTFRTRPIVLVAALAGLAVSFAWAGAGIVSQVPDTVAGLNGSYVPGPSAGVSALIIGGVGIVVGLVIGSVVAVVLHLTRRSN